MKYKIISIIILCSMLVCSCVNTNMSTNTSISSNISSEITNNHSEEKIESLDNTVTQTTLETTAEISSKVEETTTTGQFITSLPYMRKVDYDGTCIPDGYYMISGKIDNKGKNGIFNIYGLYYLYPEDVELFQDEQPLYLEKEKEPIIIIKRPINNYTTYETNENEDGTYSWLEEHQNIYYLFTYECWIVDYLLEKEYTLSIDPNVLIYENSFDKYSDTPTYTLPEFLDEMNKVGRMRHVPETYAYIQNETIIEMYVNPHAHESWKYPYHYPTTIYVKVDRTESIDGLNQKILEELRLWGDKAIRVGNSTVGEYLPRDEEGNLIPGVYEQWEDYPYLTIIVVE